MKKLAISAILGASLVISSSAFALTAMTDSGMKAATGQAGVSITLDNVKIEQYVGSTTYTDETGTTGSAGSIVISDKHVIKEYLAMTSAADYVADFNAATGGLTLADAANWNKAAALSIDVGTCSILAAGLNDNLAALDLAAIATSAAASVPATMGALMAAGNTYDAAMAIIGAATNGLGSTQDVTGVVIGLPTLLISTTADDYSVGVAKTGALNDGADFIHIAKGISAMAILGGTVEIAAH